MVEIYLKDCNFKDIKKDSEREIRCFYSFGHNNENDNRK